MNNLRWKPSVFGKYTNLLTPSIPPFPALNLRFFKKTQKSSLVFKIFVPLHPQNASKNRVYC